MNKIILQESGVSALKAAFSNIPFVGGLLSELVFDLRSRIKQERINSFVEKLGDFLGNNPTINYEALTSEDFSDLFEAVLKRVAETKSKQKHERFKEIIAGYITLPTATIDNASIFLDLLNDLDEVAIVILQHHQFFNEKFANADQELYRIEQSLSPLKEKLDKEKALYNEGFANNFGHVTNEVDIAQSKQRELKQEIARMEQFRKGEFYGLNENDFLFYKQLLHSKGLLSDNLSGAAVGGGQFHYMHTSEFGRRFIAFITNAQNSEKTS
jgi:hypothetical protein